MELLDFWNRDAFDFILLQFVVLESIFIGLSVFYHIIHKYGLLQQYKVVSCVAHPPTAAVLHPRCIPVWPGRRQSCSASA